LLAKTNQRASLTPVICLIGHHAKMAGFPRFQRFPNSVRTIGVHELPVDPRALYPGREYPGELGSPQSRSPLPGFAYQSRSLHQYGELALTSLSLLDHYKTLGHARRPSSRTLYLTVLW